MLHVDFNTNPINKPTKTASEKSTSSSSQSKSEQKPENHPPIKMTAVGAGVTAAFELYSAHLDAKAKGTTLRATLFDKNTTLDETTTVNIAASLTADESLSVIARGPLLVEKLGVKFSEPGGIRVDDVADVNTSEVAKKFIAQVLEYSKDEEGHISRIKTSLELGKMGMDEWQRVYDEADDELKKILEEANFNPCREPKLKDTVLHDGYRIDLIYSVPNAKAKAEGMKKDYESLGYQSCKILSPAEVKVLDPFLADFCDIHSDTDASEGLGWKNDTVALYRSGGCIDMQIFLPKFYAYLKKVMGQYVNEEGKVKDCLRIKFERNVKEVVFDSHDKTLVTGLRFFDDSVKYNKQTYIL